MKNVMNEMMMNKVKMIEQKPLKSNQFSSGEMICGSVGIDDSSSRTYQLNNIDAITK